MVSGPPSLFLQVYTPGTAILESYMDGKVGGGRVSLLLFAFSFVIIVRIGKELLFL
jgi:hypothetical protein